jgi:hypothetical protein
MISALAGFAGFVAGCLFVIGIVALTIELACEK